MRWKAKPRLKVGDYWRRYAWLPALIEDEWIWLEAYEQLIRQHPMVPIMILPQDVQQKLKTLPHRRRLSA